MVRRVEWQIAEINERILRSAEEDPDEDPLIMSPQFSAAGIENMQIYLYPKGYRTKHEGVCGLFLLCPQGVYVKCRAYVGDVEKVFEHHFEETPPVPYGRGSFCQIARQVDQQSDTLTVGIELLEIQQETHTKR